MKKVVAVSILLLFGLLFGPLNNTSRAQSQDAIAKQFAGMWRLVSNPQRLADGTTRQGSNSAAYVFFDAHAHHMCFISMNPNRPRWSSETAPTPEEGLSAIRGFGAYCATVEIHPKEGFIVRQYEINQNPNAVGRTTKRWYTFQGTNRMSLRVDTAELNLPVVENELIWERVTK
jgi:lipocalin-like protein